MNTDSFLGKEIINKYGDIYPIIRLVLYRMDVDWEGIFHYDNGYSSKLDKHVLVRYVPKQVLCVIKALKKKEMPGILMSDSILNLDRYDDLFEQMLDKRKNPVAFVSYFNCYRSNGGLTGVEKKRWECRSLYMPNGVIGIALKNSIIKLKELFEKVLLKQERCNLNDFDDCLSKIRILSELRISRIEKELIRNKVTLFLTRDQFNLRDLLTIMACRKIGIYTKEILHYSYCVTPIKGDGSIPDRYIFDDNHNKFLFVNESCLWNKAERDWYRKYNQVDRNIFGEKIHLSVVGCPEVTKKRLKLCNSKYIEKNYIILLVPSYVYYLGANYDTDVDEENFRMAQEWRKKIFYEIHCLAKKTGMKVIVRYHPCELQSFIDHDKLLIDKYDFCCSKSSRNDLFKYFSEGKVVFSAISSASVIACIFGCKVYSIKIGREEYDFLGLNITEIELDDISKLDLCNKKREVDCDNCIDIDLLTIYSET